MIADAHDSKDLYDDVLKTFYDWDKEISRIGIPAANGMPALRPFDVVHYSDLKTAWYLTNKGGGCKSTHFFCLLCAPVLEIDWYHITLESIAEIAADVAIKRSVIITVCVILFRCQP